MSSQPDSNVTPSGKGRLLAIVPRPTTMGEPVAVAGTIPSGTGALSVVAPPAIDPPASPAITQPMAAVVPPAAPTPETTAIMQAPTASAVTPGTSDDLTKELKTQNLLSFLEMETPAEAVERVARPLRRALVATATALCLVLGVWGLTAHVNGKAQAKAAQALSFTKLEANEARVAVTQWQAQAMAAQAKAAQLKTQLTAAKAALAAAQAQLAVQPAKKKGHRHHAHR